MFKTEIASSTSTTNIDWSDPSVIVYSNSVVAGPKGDKGDKGDDGGSGIQYIESPDYASIPSITGKAIVSVDSDEFNDGLTSLFYYDGTTLLWIPTV